jgi:hypothetical protein
VERPADAVVDHSANWSDLTPIDLDWPEWCVEAFLATYASAILACLDEPDAALIVLRQINDIDLVLLDSARDLVTLVELKKQDAPGAMDAVCQLAYNFAKARRILLQTHPAYSVRAVACGSWREGQQARGRDTVAWKYLEEQGASPRLVVYSGAVSADGRQYFLMTDGVLPFQGRGAIRLPDGLAKLKDLRQQLTRALPDGLGLAIYSRVPGLVVRFMARSPLRTAYLKSRPEMSPTGSLASFLRVERTLVGRQGIVAERVIGQQLELRIDLTPNNEDEERFYERAQRLLSDIVQLAKESHAQAAV